MAKVDNLDLVWNHLDREFNSPGEEGLSGIAYGLVKGDDIIVEFANLPTGKTLTPEERGRCVDFISTFDGFKAKKVPTKREDVLAYALRPRRI